MIQMIKLREHQGLAKRAAQWFHQKWGIPLSAYEESIGECIAKNTAVPQWYLAIADNVIAGGLGVIENDFHDRRDLAPNICAVYVEEDWRCQGIAGRMLDFVCRDMKEKGIDTLYLVTEHTSFYERYGWQFLCMVQVDDEPELSRMYIHTQSFP